MRVVVGNPPRRDVVVTDADGGDARLLASGVFSWSRPAWSPDGKRLAYAATTGGEAGLERSDIFVLEASGGRPRRLTTTGRALAPVWSPDGRTIVFAERASGARFPPTAGIWAMRADGADRRPLLEAERGRIDVPSSFSPDGSRLALTRCTWRDPAADGRRANTCGVYLLDGERLQLRRLAERAADPSFSPDGSTIAYVTDRDENGELSYGDAVSHANELYVMDADGGDPRRLTRTRDRNERAPMWSPDARLIAYQRGEVTGNAEGTVVLTVRADGTCPRAIAFAPGLSVWYSSPAWRPGSAVGDACRRGAAPPAAVPLAGNLSIADARRFRAYGLYWAGRRFDAFVLSSIDRTSMSGPGGRGPVVSLDYGGFQIQNWPACARVPGHVHAGAERRIRVRGVDAFVFEDGYRLEVVTGETTIVLFGERRRIVRVARALRPLNPAVVRGGGEGNLAPPAPGALERRLRCR